MKDEAKNEYLRRLGIKIKELRTAKGYTQEQLAKTIGYCGKDSISKIERGLFEVNAERLCAIAITLGVEPAELLLLDEERADRAKQRVRYAAYFDYVQDYTVVNDIQERLTSLTADQMKQVLNFIKAITQD